MKASERPRIYDDRAERAPRVKMFRANAHETPLRLWRRAAPRLGAGRVDERSGLVAETTTSFHSDRPRHDDLPPVVLAREHPFCRLERPDDAPAASVEVAGQRPPVVAAVLAIARSGATVRRRRALGLLDDVRAPVAPPLDTAP